MISTEQLRKLEDLDVKECKENDVHGGENTSEGLLNNDLEIKYHNSLTKVENVISNIRQILSNITPDSDKFVDQFKKILSSIFKIQTLISSIHVLDSLSDSFKDTTEYERELLEYIEDFESEYQLLTSLESPNLQISDLQTTGSKNDLRKQLSDVTSRYIHLKRDYELLLSRIESDSGDKKQEPSEKFKILVQESKDKDSQIADLKRQLSAQKSGEHDRQRTENNNYIEQLNEKISHLNVKISHLNAKNDDYRTQVETLKSRLENEQKHSLTERKNLEEHIKSLTNKMRDGDNGEKRDDGKESDEGKEKTKIETLKSQLDNTTSHVHQLTSHIQTLTDHIEDISSELERKTQENQDLTEQLNASKSTDKIDGNTNVDNNTYISSLEAKIKKLETRLHKMNLLLSISVKM